MSTLYILDCRYKAFSHSLFQVAEAFSVIEQDLHLLGATAVEDRLQDRVPETMEALREPPIKILNYNPAV